jgi:Protein of unknown function (DUF4038)/Putative collagen-binding domain of a collagenase
VDQNNTPFLMVGDAPHSLIVNLDQADASTYLFNRAANGFNALWVEALCFPYTGGPANGSLLNGTLPFTNMLTGGYYDLTKPNSNYFAYVDTVLTMAATNHLLVLLDPCETGGWLATMTNNGSNSCWIYGQYLGKRYKGFTNLVWLSGNDFDVTMWSIPTNDVCVRAVARGIASMDTNHFQTVELGADYANPDSLSDSNWWPIIKLNLVYDFSQTYAGCYRAYGRTNLVPCFNGEQHYESEVNGFPTDNVEMGTPLVLRHQEYWTLLSGACGQVYGNTYIWQFLSAWQNNLDTIGVQQLQYNTALFRSRAWYNLIPDITHTFLTAGYGTYATNGLISTNDYATAAITPDGSLALIYLPTVRSITVNLSKMAGLITARWYDPTSGGYETISDFPFANAGAQIFTPPRNNSAGDGDWVLVLEVNPPTVVITKPAFIQRNYTTPPTSQSMVASAYPAAQKVGDANIVAIGWDTPLATISTVTDSIGNKYQAALPTYRSNGLSQAIYYATDIMGGTNTVTIKFNIAAAHVSLAVSEYSGLSQSNAFSAGSSATGDGTNASSGPVTTTATNELLFCAGYTTSHFTSSGVGLAQRVIASSEGGMVEDEVVATVGTYNPTATLSSSTWVMQVAAFNAAKSLVVPQITGVIRTNKNFVVKFGTVSGQTYALHGTTNLSSGAWLPMVTNIQGTGGVVQATDTNAASHPTRFYRVSSPN